MSINLYLKSLPGRPKKSSRQQLEKAKQLSNDYHLLREKLKKF